MGPGPGRGEAPMKGKPRAQQQQQQRPQASDRMYGKKAGEAESEPLVQHSVRVDEKDVGALCFL